MRLFYKFAASIKNLITMRKVYKHTLADNDTITLRIPAELQSEGRNVTQPVVY